jgi:predicted nucleic acid-binding protein
MICVDANIVLEIIEKRKNAEICERFLTTVAGERAISILTLDIVMYFVEKDKIVPAPAKAFLESFTWLPVTEADAGWAFEHFDGKDFEDGLQIACAMREGCSTFATLDQGLAKKYTAHLPVKLLKN